MSLILVYEQCANLKCLNSAEDETVTSLSVEASRKALEMANVKPEEVDLLLLCTSTPDDLFGSAPQVGVHI
jgi:3-oxoacyl-[acyl-carrier-protein] synthase III